MGYGLYPFLANPYRAKGFRARIMVRFRPLGNLRGTRHSLAASEMKCYP